MDTIAARNSRETEARKCIYGEITCRNLDTSECEEKSATTD
jgi:hypothetical protein